MSLTLLLIYLTVSVFTSHIVENDRYPEGLIHANIYFYIIMATHHVTFSNVAGFAS